MHVSQDDGSRRTGSPDLGEEGAGDRHYKEEEEASLPPSYPPSYPPSESGFDGELLCEDADEVGDEWTPAAAAYSEPPEEAAKEYESKQTAPCDICGRCFVVDRLEKHMKACKTSGKKRKVFGASAERLKLQEKATEEEAKKAKDRAEKKAVWKAQHEAFQNALKSAAAIKNGEPPPADMHEVEDTRVPCPHCGRKFNADVADRHIPSCAKAIKRPNPVGGERKRPGKSSPSSSQSADYTADHAPAPAPQPRAPEPKSTATPAKQRPPIASSPTKKKGVAGVQSPSTSKRPGGATLQRRVAA